MDRTDLAQDRDKWWDHINLVMNCGFHNMWGTSWQAEELLE